MKYLFCILYIATVAYTANISYIYGAQDTHQVQLSLVADDYTAPTIPTGLTAITHSDTRIDLAWNASTDDVAVAGYRIYRDGNIIASTTSLFYSDTGLIQNTNYDYEVEAFDNVPRYSGLSATATATTSVTVVVTPTATTTTTSNTGTSGSLILTINNLNVVSNKNSAVVNFITNLPTQARVFWGTTVDYTAGSILGLTYGTDHSVKIEGLNPSTTYYFKIEVIDAIGRIRSIASTFQTRSEYIENMLTNVNDFRATPQSDSISLTWNNPEYADFDSVRIVRSDKFFPRDITDGAIIYEGSSENYLDTDVEKGTTYYYSIFAKDKNGNYSSGALAYARINKAGETDTVKSGDPFKDIGVLENVNEIISRLLLSDFDFIQSGRKLVNTGNTVVIDGKENLTILLGYGKIPEILKTIAFTLIDPEDSSRVFPFLLRVNKDKTAYEATIAPLGKSGRYEMKIVILDYKNKGLKRLEGSLTAFVFGQAQDILNGRGIKIGNNYVLLLIIIILLLIALFVFHRRKKNKEIEI